MLRPTGSKLAAEDEGLPAPAAPKVDRTASGALAAFVDDAVAVVVDAVAHLRGAPTCIGGVVVAAVLAPADAVAVRVFPRAARTQSTNPSAGSARGGRRFARGGHGRHSNSGVAAARIGRDRVGDLLRPAVDPPLKLGHVPARSASRARRTYAARTDRSSPPTRSGRGPPPTNMKECTSGRDAPSRWGPRPRLGGGDEHPATRAKYVDAMPGRCRSGTSRRCRVGMTWSQQIAADVAADPRRWATVPEFQAAVATARDVVATRAQFLQSFVDCARNGTGDDRDGDGVGWCDGLPRRQPRRAPGRRGDPRQRRRRQLRRRRRRRLLTLRSPFGSPSGARGRGPLGLRSKAWNPSAATIQAASSAPAEGRPPPRL